MVEQIFGFDDLESPTSTTYDLTTAGPATVFPSFVGLHVEARQHDPLGEQDISSLCFSPHLLSHIDLPTDMPRYDVEKAKLLSPVLSAIIRYEPVILNCLILDLSATAKVAIEFVSKHVWAFASRGKTDSQVVRDILPDLIDPNVKYDDLDSLHHALEVDIEPLLRDLDLTETLIVLWTDRQSYISSDRDISSSFLEGWHMSWFYPFISLDSAKWLVGKGVAGIATDAYSIDSFCYSLSGHSFSPAVQRLYREKSRLHGYASQCVREGPVHDELFASKKLVIENITVPGSIFAPDRDRSQRVLDGLRSAEQHTSANRTDCPAIARGRLLLVPFFVVLEMGAAVVSLYADIAERL